ncbi:serine hydrolase [Paenibacillus sp. SGZ-1009]|uniref:serine hydrolase n=1 Tax=Paenibacillus campi TaxID=3106031 RepID=UPI002AFF928C|nr:serine hydrolase [Paenibacillus sp. SGZ-1009]
MKFSSIGARFRFAVRFVTVTALTVSLGIDSSNAPQAAAASSATPAVITIAGQQINWSTAPFVRNGTTMIPLREAALKLGACTSWDAATRSVVMYNNGDRIVHTPGTSTITLDGYRLSMPEASRNINGTMMVPARFVAEAFKAKLTLNTTAQLATIDLTPDASTVRATAAQNVDTYLQAQGYSGLALVESNGKVILKKGYGLSAVGKATAPNGISRIASLSKSFTAAAIMKLVQDGKISLDDKLTTYIPDFPRGDDITIHMLLSHTAGFNSNFTRRIGTTLQDTVNEIKTKPLRFEPGTTFNYSNQGYVLLAYIVQLASGKTYGQYIQHTFLDPLHMNHTGEATPATKTIAGFVKHKATGAWVEGDYYWSQSGTGTFYSSLDDMMTWYQSFANYTILNQTSVERMLTPHSNLKPYGYAFLIKNIDGKHTIYHNGSGTGYSTGFTYNLDDDVMVVLLGNHYGIDIAKLLVQTQTLANDTLIK